MYEEAYPVFYTTQTFHYSFTTGFSPWERERFVRQGAMPYFSKNLDLKVNLSISLEFNMDNNDNAVLSEQIARFAQHCPRLRTLTIHFLTEKMDFLANSATASVLQQLLPRLDSLSFIVLAYRGWSPHEVIPRLRHSIADDRYWSNECISERPDGTRESQWPYLTIPSMIQSQVHEACYRSGSSDWFRFSYPLPGHDNVYEWTCQNKVNEEVHLD